MNKERGFTLLELMIVVSVAAVIMAIVMPSLYRAKRAANETAAVSFLKSIHAAQTLYRRFGRYADSDEELVAAGFLGGGSQNAKKSRRNTVAGYGFMVDVDPASPEYWIGEAIPREPGATGDRYFFIDITGVIRFSDKGRASVNDPPWK